MCGIVGIVSKYESAPLITLPQVDQAIDRVDEALPDLDAVALAAANLDQLLKVARAMHVLLRHPELVVKIQGLLDRLVTFADDHESALEEAAPASEADAEKESGKLIELRDALWALRNDRLRMVRSLGELVSSGAGLCTVDSYLSICQALAALDRLEIRGRDSAGVHVFVWGHALDATLRSLLEPRSRVPEFTSGAVSVRADTVSFVYKTAEEIGALGDNTAQLRSAIKADDLLHRLLAEPDARISVLGHTRWASFGVVSEANAHPVNSYEQGAEHADGHYVVAALNGDVDNHAQLRAEHELKVPSLITTDAKVIPTLIARAMRSGSHTFVDAFRKTVVRFDGSVATAASSADSPGLLAIAQRGNGQGLYVGVADDRFVVGSEPYAIVEETRRYVRMDGDHGGQIIVVDGAGAGADLTSALTRYAYDGNELPITEADVVTAEMTSRDIDRGNNPHFFIKELDESPESVHRTIRRRIHDHSGVLRSSLGDTIVSPLVRERLGNGTISVVRVVGQGTAAIAGRAIASLIEDMTAGALDVKALPATELSGFYLKSDMKDTLVIAVSQSGTTNDTNVTVGLARGRGASVIAIVNRRGSDLCDLADGVLFTSDGRDLEMSVASTKAFYSQAAAGALLACEIGAITGHGSAQRRHELLESLRLLPDAMRVVIDAREHIAEIATRLGPTKRYWTVVGNGPNKVAAEELRIKLSELCYKSISFDVTEDKKHIDLSCEPLILVCAVGLTSGAAEDVAKEIATFSAHKSVPIVIIDERQVLAVGRSRYVGASLIEVPAIDQALGFVLAAVAGHLFGYEAAVAIDASAIPLRRAREALDSALATSDTSDEALKQLATMIRPSADQFMSDLALRRFEGQLEPSTAVRIMSRFRDLMSERPLDEYHRFTGKVATPSNLLDDVASAIALGIDELTRPIDAIKHQAKTVTVGISRNDEKLMDRALVAKVLESGAARDTINYQTMKTIAGLDSAVLEVTGYTRYSVEGDVIRVVDQSGIARQLQSRVGDGAPLTGTKRQVVVQQTVLVARGRRDGRTLIFVPEVKGSTCTGITLLHVRFVDHLTAPRAREVLEAYDRRYDRLVDWVTETEPVFDESLLTEVPVEQLLIDPISDVADRWRPSSTTNT